MRTLLISLILCCVGFGAAALVTSPAGAHLLVDGTLTGAVGTSGNHDAYSISLSTGAVAPGTYEIDVTDYSQIHDFHFCNKGVDATHCASGAPVDMATDISGTGPTQWTVDLPEGVYIYFCDVHRSMHGTLVVGNPDTTPALTLKFVSTTVTRKVVTVKAKANQQSHFTGVLLDKTQTNQLATVETDGTTVTLKLKPATKLAKGKYVIKLTADAGSKSLTKQKTITVT
jgi:plastocyanin